MSKKNCNVASKKSTKEAQTTETTELKEKNDGYDQELFDKYGIKFYFAFA